MGWTGLFSFRHRSVPHSFEISVDLFFTDTNARTTMVWQQVAFDKSIDRGHGAVESLCDFRNFEKHGHIPFHKCVIRIFTGTNAAPGKDGATIKNWMVGNR